MNLPETIKILIITLSDRAFKGEYDDLSGPAAEEEVTTFFSQSGMNFTTERLLIADDRNSLEQIIMEYHVKKDIIITTGGTGIGPRDITVDTIRPLLDKEIPGVMEHIRVKYGMEKPNALLSRAIAGVKGSCLIYTLPGSVKAVKEYMSEIKSTLEHTLYMLYGIDRHKK